MKKHFSKSRKVSANKILLNDWPNGTNLTDEQAANFRGGAISLPLDFGREFIPKFPTCPNPNDAAPGC